MRLANTSRLVPGAVVRPRKTFAIVGVDFTPADPAVVLKVYGSAKRRPFQVCFPFIATRTLHGTPASGGPVLSTRIGEPSGCYVTDNVSERWMVEHPPPRGDLLAAFEAHLLAGEEAAAARFILDHWRGA